MNAPQESLSQSISQLMMPQNERLENKPSPFTDSIMDAVKWKESRGNTNAVNPKSGAEGDYQFLPATTKWLSGKYGEFNPKDPTQSRPMAKQYLDDLYKSTGSVEKALAAYGGHIKTDPTEYVQSILGKAKEYEFDNSRRILLADTGSTSQSILDMMNAKPAAPAAPGPAAPTPAAPTPAAPTPAAPEQTGGRAGNIDSLVQQPSTAAPPAAPTVAPAVAPAKPAAPAQPALPALPVNAAQITSETLAVPRSLNDAFEAAKGTVSYWTQRISGKSADEATKGSQNTSLTSEMYKIITGKELQPGKPEDTNFTRQMNFLGEHIGENTQWLSDKTGIPKTDIEQALSALGIVAGGKAPIKGVAGATTTAAKGAVGTAAKAVGDVIPPAIKEATIKAAAATKQAAQATASAINKINPRSGTVNFQKVPTVERAPITESYSPKEDAGYTQKRAPKEQQIERAQVLIRTGSTETHSSVVLGDGPQRSTLYALSNTDSPLGHHIRENVFNKEYAETDAFSKKLIADVGGTHGMNQSALRVRGKNIEAPILELDTWFDKERGRIYKLRDEEAGAVPVRLDKTLELLKDPSMNALNPETAGLASTTLAWMKKKGAIDADGNVLDVNGKIAEEIRKAVNANKDFKTSGLWKALRDSIDEDVFAYAGKTLYDDARKLVVMQKATIDNPKGISNLIAVDGVNRKVSYDKTAANVVGLPHEQLSHIVETLRTKMPPHLQKSADKAIAEIKSQYLNEINELGNSSTGSNTKMWNAKKVSEFLKHSDEDMKLLFTPEERAKIADLNDRGQILRTDTGYKGAGVQTFNIGEQGIISKTISTAAMAGTEAVTGGTLGIVGSFVKNTMDKRATSKAQEKRVREEQKKTIQLKDIGKK